MIFITYGNDARKNTYDILAASDIGEYLHAKDKVAIKPNLVTARPASDGATTHPEVVEGIILFLRDFGVKSISVMESSAVGGNTNTAYKNCGYDELSRKYDVPLIDLKAGKHTTLEYKGQKLGIFDEALKTDFLINAPVLKAHSQTRLTCCMKNLKGCIPDSEKRRYHTLGIHKPVAALNALLKTGYNVVDGICGDLSFEEGGSPVESGRIIAGRDPLLVDSYCAELIGYNPGEIGYLSLGREWGLGEYYSDRTEVVELNRENKPVFQPRGSRTADRYRNLIHEDSACSVCHASLIYALHRLGGKTSAADKICIGQGFRGKSGGGIGVGNCTGGFAKCVPGCPPKSTDIIEALR